MRSKVSPRRFSGSPKVRGYAESCVWLSLRRAARLVAWVGLRLRKSTINGRAPWASVADAPYCEWTEDRRWEDDGGRPSRVIEARKFPASRIPRREMRPWSTRRERNPSGRTSPVQLERSNRAGA
jgi:hypothetical protein